MGKILKDFGYTPLGIEFNERNHRYKLDGVFLTGTTTVIGIRDKPFLMFWTVKEMWKYLTENWDIDKRYTKEEKAELLMLGKKAWTVKKDKALDSGKITHKLVQEAIENGGRTLAYFHKNDQVQTEVSNAYQAWIDWENKHDIEYLATEMIVGSKIHYTGGTIDAIAIVDGQLELLDWKTSKQLGDDVFLQLAAYKMMLLEGGVDTNIKRRTVRLDKTGSGAEELSIKSTYEKDRDTFLALLKTYRWQKRIKRDCMDRSGKLITLKIK